MTTRFLSEKDLERAATKAALAQLNVFYDVEAKRAPGHALDNTTRLYASVVYKGYEKSFAAIHKVKKAGGVCCPMRLLGKRCGRHIAPNYYCEEHDPRSVDHASLWNRDGKPFLMVWHPYGLSYQDIRFLTTYCERLGFQFEIDTGPSFYFPAVTPTVIMNRAGENLR